MCLRESVQIKNIRKRKNFTDEWSGENGMCGAGLSPWSRLQMDLQCQSVVMGTITNISAELIQLYLVAMEGYPLGYKQTCFRDVLPITCPWVRASASARRNRKRTTSVVLRGRLYY